ncbi:hypothetical protein IIB50_02465 [Patescibacteria group bacterium]|nr:hypothetical protein [Patescibacteria group bacterium]
MEEENSQKISVSLIAVLIVFGLMLLGYAAYSKDGRFSFDQYKKDKIQQEDNLSTKSAGSLAITHFYSDGEHTYFGHIETPTPCHELSSQIQVRQTKPEQVTLSFETKSIAGACAQVISKQAFALTFSAERDAVVRAIFNGELFDLEVTEVSSLEGL